LFASFLGYNPLEHLLDPHVIASLPTGTRNLALAKRSFFPSIIYKTLSQTVCTRPVTSGRVGVSFGRGLLNGLRGGKYVYVEKSNEPGEVFNRSIGLMNSRFLGLARYGGCCDGSWRRRGTGGRRPRANEFNSNSKVEVDEPNFNVLRRWCSVAFLESRDVPILFSTQNRVFRSRSNIHYLDVGDRCRKEFQ